MFSILGKLWIFELLFKSTLKGRMIETCMEKPTCFILVADSIGYFIFVSIEKY